ncbi:MAG TPA: hypothetical protein VEQ65_14210 [Opitutus sp.]|nr:hypothetical protein [Opitutus sp.]
MLVGSPARVAKSPAFTDATALLLPPERLHAFEQATAVDLRHVSEGVIAGFDLGHVYVFTPPSGAADRIFESFRATWVDAAADVRPHPALRRASGVAGKSPEMLVQIDGKLIAVAVRDLTLGRVVEAFARKKLARSPSALRGASLSALTPPPADAVATFYVPGPFTGEWAQGARGLLADAVALSISVAPSGARSARFTVQVAGDLPPPAADELSAAYVDIAQSSTGKLLGLDQPKTPPQVHEREGRLLLDLELDLGPLARGLRAAVIADVWEIMGVPPPATP